MLNLRLDPRRSIGLVMVALVSVALSSAAAQAPASGSITGAVRRDDGQRGRLEQSSSSSEPMAGHSG